MTIKESLFVCIFFSFSFLLNLHAFDASPPCFKDLELNFFEPSLVSQALSLHNIDQPIWTPIIELLQHESKKVPQILREKADRMDPNPFSPRFIPELAKDLLHQTLLEIFSRVLISYNSNQNARFNGTDIQEMFNYISSKQAQKLDACFRR